MEVSSHQTIRLKIGGLYPGAVFRQETDDDTTEVKTDRRGDLALTVTGKTNPVSIRITKTKK